METAVVDLIYGAIRAERFCDGAILAFLKDGTIVRWLERLKTLDANVENIAVKWTEEAVKNISMNMEN